MFARLMAFPAAAVLLAVWPASAAHAADKLYCDQYAKAAINQVRTALSNRKCADGVQGDRWSAEYHAHYDWCLENNYGTSGNERDARTAYIKACTAQQ